MPWPETDVLDQRTLFMAAWLTREESVIPPQADAGAST